MSRTTFQLDPDRDRQNDPAYWSAAAVLADSAGDSDRAELARKHLARLGYTLRRDQTTKGNVGKAVADAR